MSVVLVISLLILSHFLTDFLMRENNSILKHTAVYLLCSVTFTVAFISFYLWLIIFVISIMFFIVNKVKVVMSQEHTYLKTFIWFISEHITRLILIVGSYPFLKHIEPNAYMNIFINKTISLYPYLEVINDINLLSYIILVIAGFIFSIRGGTRLSLIIINLPKENRVPLIKNKGISNSSLLGQQEAAAAIEKDNLNEMNTSGISNEERMKYGKVIGIIERIIIISAVLFSLYQIIVIMTAIKSIGRFKEINNKTSDYYIIGNFASFSIAFLIGFILLAAKSILIG